MVEKYKMEYWKHTYYKGQKNEYTRTHEVLVRRDAKGHFTGKIPVIRELRQKTYGSGVYIIGVYNGKIVTRKRIHLLTQEWKREHKKEIEEIIKRRQIYRTSYVLNDIPFRGNVYYGFRIVAFSHSKSLLISLRPKLKEKLIAFIEKCLHYRQDEFWFSMYFGYEAPTPCNAYLSDNNKFTLLWQKRYGSTIKEETHNLRELL